MSERIYIDTCALSRPTDDQRQTRIRTETEAIFKVLDAVAENAVDWVASSILFAELSRNPDQQHRQDTLRFLPMALQYVQPTQTTFSRAEQLRADGFGEFDALYRGESCRMCRWKQLWLIKR